MVTPKGQSWLKKPSSLRLKPSTEMFKMLHPKKTSRMVESLGSTSGPRLNNNLGPTRSKDITQELIKMLLLKRSELASSFNVMPYMIASNAALYKLAELKPLNLE